MLLLICKTNVFMVIFKTVLCNLMFFICALLLQCLEQILQCCIASQLHSPKLNTVRGTRNFTNLTLNTSSVSIKVQ